MNDIEAPIRKLATTEPPKPRKASTILSAKAFVESKPSVYGALFGDYTLLHDPALSAEILEPRPIAAIPNTASWFVGMINVRGALVPVFDLGLLIKPEKTSRSRRDVRRIMVIGHAGRAAGVLIEHLPQRLDLDALVKAPDSSIPDILEVAHIQTYQAEGTTWVEVDFEKLFSLLGESVLEHD